jgi:hypothetical protein
MIPIEVVNIILDYIGDLNNNIIKTQFKLLTNEEYYKINFNSDLLWKIKSVLVMKQKYPICDFFYNKNNITLYKNGVEHYEKQLRQHKHV